MTIEHHLDTRGGFTVGDTETGATVYCYPSSPLALAAKHDPDIVAHAALAGEGTGISRGSPALVAEYDRLNWERLGARRS